MYNYQVNFTKRFTNGPFKLSLYHDHTRFATLEAATAYKDRLESGVEIGPSAGVSSYIAEDVTMFEIEPMFTEKN